MNAEQRLLDWGFVLRWVAITTLTFLLLAVGLLLAACGGASEPVLSLIHI